MPGKLLHVGMTCICPHAGQVQAIASSPRVTLGGQPAVTISDTFLIAGCPFQVLTPVKPQPCVKVLWIVPAMRVFIDKKPVLLTDSTGLCQSIEQIPQGPPNVIVTQLKVSGQ